MAYIAERIRIEDRGFTTPCWVCTLALGAGGYARGSVPFMGFIPMHRASYWLIRGEIPQGLVIDHLCRVRSCCNPDHLEAVTPAENTRRGKGRAFCKRGHKRSPENVRKGSRTCIICHREYMVLHNRRRRARETMARRARKLAAVKAIVAKAPRT